MKPIALSIFLLLPLVANAAEQKKIAPKQNNGLARSEAVKLKKLSLNKLRIEAKKGRPLAAMAIAQHLATEAQELTALPVLANSAAEDAIRWSSLAAKMGALEGRTVDVFGTFPIRAIRSR